MYIQTHHHFLTFSTSQVSPSSSPSWVFAEQAVIVHTRVWIFSIFSCYKIYVNWQILELVIRLGPDLAYLRKSRGGKQIIPSRLEVIKVLFQLLLLFLYRQSLWHKLGHQYSRNNCPSTLSKLFVLRYPRHWAWTYRGLNSWYWILE